MEEEHFYIPPEKVRGGYGKMGCSPKKAIPPVERKNSMGRMAISRQ
jgi:hypothetical protein